MNSSIESDKRRSFFFLDDYSLFTFLDMTFFFFFYLG